MTEVVVISGKGGSGKTSLTASFAYIAKNQIVTADCDVDAADMHLLLEPDFEQREGFKSGLLAIINQESCISCNRCFEVCRFDAINVDDGKYEVNDISCEGCGYCPRVCPVDAIKMEEQEVGEWYVSNIKEGGKMVHARLGVGEENSGKLVAKVKNEAKRLAKELCREFVLVDGSPGIGCPVVSSLSGADFVVFVTEPTVSGYHDLKRVYQLVAKFKIRCGCIINKSDLNSEIATEIKQFMQENEIVELLDVPYDETFTKAMTVGKTIVEFEENELTKSIEKTWENIKIISQNK